MNKLENLMFWMADRLEILMDDIAYNRQRGTEKTTALRLEVIVTAIHAAVMTIFTKYEIIGKYDGWLEERYV